MLLNDKKRYSCRHGFTLLVTLVLIALAAAMLARIANRGLVATLEFRTRSEALQRKWAITSARLAILAQAERLMADADARQETAGIGWPFPGALEGKFTSGGVTYQLLLADEQAKLNLNTVYEQKPHALQELFLTAQRNAMLHIPLRPEAAYPEVSEERQPPFTSWGQIVDFSQLALSPQMNKNMLYLANLFSCAPATELNVRRASDEALRQTVQLVVSNVVAEKLVESRRGYVGSVGDWLRSVELPSRYLFPLQRLLGEQSRHYSLWIMDDRQWVLATKGSVSGNIQERVLSWP